MQQWVDRASIVLVAAAAVLLVAAAARVVKRPARQAVAVRDWESLVDTSRLMEPGMREVRIVEFSDFQCPYCMRAQAGLHALQARYPGKIAVVYRHLPLTGAHPFAMGAALAAECARDQGRFRAYHDALYQEQARIGHTGWEAFAASAGVADLPAFRACVRSARHQGRIDEDVRHARRLGIAGTPSFIVEGRLLAGPLDTPETDSIIRSRLAALGPPTAGSGLDSVSRQTHIARAN